MCLIYRLPLIKDWLGSCINVTWKHKCLLEQKPGARNLGAPFQNGLVCNQLHCPIALFSSFNYTDEGINFNFLVYNKPDWSLGLSRPLTIINSTYQILSSILRWLISNIPNNYPIIAGPNSTDIVTWMCLVAWNRKHCYFSYFMTNTVDILNLKCKVLCWSDFDLELQSKSTVSSVQHNTQKKSPLGNIFGVKRLKCARLDLTHTNK